MDASILNSVKDLLGVQHEEHGFDSELIFHINRAFLNLNQIGVGPNDVFSIEDDTAMWSDFIDEAGFVGSICEFVYLKVKMLFDPPASNVLMEALNELTKETEWRLREQLDEYVHEEVITTNG